MKTTLSALLTFAFCLLIVSAAFAQKPAPPAIKGIYENFTVGAGSGDLEGMRVILFTAHDEYFAIVQIAQGGAEDPSPEFVKATVTGNKVEFTVADQKYTGNVTTAGLRINNSLLKRKACTEFFK
jgi:hypothetical protein